MTVRCDMYIGPQLKEIILALKDISDPCTLGVHLGIELPKLKKIERNHRQDVNRQMIEVIEYWRQSRSDHSWEALASAVENMGGHGNLVQELKDKHLENTTTTASS